MPDTSVTWFISDLHLDIARPQTSRAFNDFLDRISGCDALYILGDLFEAWPGDDDDSPLAEATRVRLAAFSAGGSRLYLLHGNRDFMLGMRFCKVTGATLLPDPTVENLYGTPTLLMHGDSLCTRDVDYLAFRKQARSTQWQSDMMARGLHERRRLAADLRRISHEASSNKAADIIDVTPAEVERVMTEHGAARLIHGHTHRPGRHNHDAGVRWVLGDWENAPAGVKVTPEQCSLVEIF